MKTLFFRTSEYFCRNCSFILLLWTLLIIPGAMPNKIAAQIFTRVTDPVFTGKTNFGFGCGFFDFNNDGKLDIFVNNRKGKSLLFKNNGDGTFSDAAFDLIASLTSNSGLSLGDYDNDGKADLFISSMKGTNSLLHNEGNGSYLRQADNPMSKAAGFQVHCTWVDYDNDGLLDLFIPVVGNPVFQKGDGVSNFLFHNNGNGRFTSVGESEPEKIVGNNVCANFSDIDNDGDMDLYMTDCQTDNYLFENKGNGAFARIDAGISANTNTSISCSWGDYDNDGFMDLFVSNGFVSDEGKKIQNYLYHNNGDKTFTKITTGALAEFSGNTWNGLWADFDNDGDLDLFLGTLYEPDVLFLNNGYGTFTKDSEFDALSNGTSGACFGDYNNDGFLDLFTANCLGTGNLLYKNNGNKNNWIFINCEGSVSNRSAIGARVKIKANIFGKSYWQVREINGNMGFRGLSEIRAHFGLGDAVKVDSLIIEWPSKKRTIMTNLQVNQVHFIKE
ncbi:MAG: CRTAC1 family protein [Methanococcaceae archaeon]